MITQEELHEILEYNPENGLFRWKSVFNKRERGWFAGSSTGRYLMIWIKGKYYQTHRIAWLYTSGHWPKEIDHINRNKMDNRITNLRDVSKSQNTINAGLRIDNKHGSTGIHFDNRKANKQWFASIKKGKEKRSAYFSTKEEAIECRKKWELELYPELCS